MSEMVVSPRRRAKAAAWALAHGMPRTHTAIIDGETPERVREIAESELNDKYSQCTCGEGSSQLAKARAEFVYHEMLDYHRGSGSYF